MARKRTPKTTMTAIAQAGREVEEDEGCREDEVKEGFEEVREEEEDGADAEEEEATAAEETLESDEAMRD